MDTMRVSRVKPRRGGAGKIPIIVIALVFFLASSKYLISFIGVKTSFIEVNRVNLGIDTDNDTISEDYKWEITFEFKDKAGNTHIGNVRKTGNKEGTTLHIPKSVYYIASHPSFYVTEVEDGNAKLAGSILFGIGSSLILLTVFIDISIYIKQKRVSK